MKKYALILFLIVNLPSTNYSQILPDTSKIIIQAWSLTDNFTATKPYKIDTSLISFQIFNPLFINSISNSWLGNLGAASISNIYSERKYHDFLFLQPYLGYIHLPESQYYINTKRPYTRVTYTSGGTKKKAEQSIKFIHTQNVTRDFNIGGTYDIHSTEGQYQYQKTKDGAITFFANYIKDNYSIHGNINFNKINVLENGGITDDKFIEDTTVNTETIPVHLFEATNVIKNNSLFIVQQIHLRKKELKQETDSVADNIVNTDTNNLEIAGLNNSSNSLVHIFKYEKTHRQYIDNQPSGEFYANDVFFINLTKTNDIASLRFLSNTLLWKFNQQKSDLNTFGFQVSLTNQFAKYFNRTPTDTIVTNNLNDTIIKKSVEKDFVNNSFGVKFIKQFEKKWTLSLSGTYFFSGYKSGDIYVKSFVNKLIPGEKTTSNLTLSGIINKRRPDYLLNNYASNHFLWNNDFDDINEITLDLNFSNQKYKFETGIKYINIDNYVYFDTTAYPIQEASGFGVISAYVYKNFDIGKFFIKNKIIYQHSTNKQVLRLPELSIFNSIYFEQIIRFKVTGGVIFSQIGFDIYYNTKFYSSAYMPATGSFYEQNTKELGNYPYIDVFINARVKRTRFFFKYAHVNAGLFDKNYFTALHYPMNFRTFKFGVLWTFYD